MLWDIQRHSENFLVLLTDLRSQGVNSTEYGVRTPGSVGSGARDFTSLIWAMGIKYLTLGLL